MAQETDIILKLKVDTSDSVNELEAVEKSMIDIEEATKHATEEYAILHRQVRDYKKVAIAAGATSPVGKEAIKKVAELRDKIQEVEDLIEDTRLGGESLNGVIGISQTAINSYGAFQAVSAIVGVENEKLMETMVKLQAAQQLLNSLESVRGQLMQKNAVVTKGLAAVQKAYTVAVGTSTGAMKAFRLALIATGIGAIVVAVGFLIANFEKLDGWIQKGIEKFESMGMAIKFLMPPIWALIEGYKFIKQALQDFGITDSEETIKMKENAQKRIDSLKDEEKAINNKYDFEIAKARAAGKETAELEQEKRNALMERIKAEGKAIVQLAKLSGEFTDEQKEHAQELVDTYRKLAQDSAIARITQEKKVTENFKKELNERAKAGEVKAKEDSKKLQEEQDRADAQFDLMNELILSAQDLELQNLAKFYDDKFALAEGNAELEKELLIKQEQDVAEIKRSFAEAKLEAEAEQAFALMELRIEMKELRAGELSDDASPEEVMAYYENRREIEDEQFELEKERLTADLDSKNISQEEYLLRNQNATQNNSNNIKKIKEEEAAFEQKLNDMKVANNMAAAGSMLNSVATLASEGSAIGKAAAVGQATMDTYKSAVAAYAAGSSVGGPAGLVLGPLAAGLAVAAGIKNVQGILSTKTPGGGSGGAGVSLPSVPSTSALPIPASTPDPEGTLTEGLLGEEETENKMKVVVLESDIANATQSNKNSVDLSQL